MRNWRPAFLRMLLLFGLLSGCSPVAWSQDSSPPTDAPLTNADVIRMTQLKFGDSVVIAKIKASSCRFDIGMEALSKLKEAGVSDSIIQVMVEVGAAHNAATEAKSKEAPPVDPNDPRTPHPAGIYWLSKEARDKGLVQLEPTVYSGGKTGGVLASAMTYGLAKTKWKAVVRSKQANQRIAEEKPEFWFYFESATHGLGHGGAYWIAGATSPNEFVLAKMNVKKDERELVVGEWNAFGASTGTRSKDTVAMRIEKIAPGIYRVIAENPLPPGEYCFFYAGGTAAMGVSGGRLFDFGIYPAK